MMISMRDASALGVALVLGAGAATQIGGGRHHGDAGPVARAADRVTQIRMPIVYLPFAVRDARLEDLPAVSTAVPSPTPSATPTATPSPTPIPCGPLGERVSVSSLDVRPATVKVSRERRATPAPVMMAVGPGGDTAVAWADTDGELHVTPLEADEPGPAQRASSPAEMSATHGAAGAPAFGRSGPDVTLPGESVRGLVVHDDGYALLAVRGDEMHLVRVTRDGEEVFDKRLVGGVSQTVSGNKWVDSWGHEGRLVWSSVDQRYAAYFGHTQFWGAQGKHQGDLLWFFDADGERVTESGAGWDWGCSHSLDARLAINGTRIGPVCLSDAYPSEGFHFNHRTPIRAEPSGDGRGYSAANLGGLVPTADGFWMSFSSPEGRSSSDVGLMSISNDGEVAGPWWLTDTPGVDEAAPHLARYGPSGFLAGWRVADALTLVETHDDGSLAGAPVVVDAAIWDRDDFTRLPNGDVAWGAAWGDLQQLRLVRVGYCSMEEG